MTDDPEVVKQAVSVDIGDDGIAATNPIRVEFPRRVATSTDDKHNTVKSFLIVVGCSSLPHDRFDFDSSFVLPEARGSFIKLAKLRDDLSEKPEPPPGQPPDSNAEPLPPPLSLFGHADPVGEPAYNSPLSQRRAAA